MCVRNRTAQLAVLLLPCKNDADPEEQKAKILASLIQDHGLTGLGEISLVSVAKQKPITRKQYEEAATYWPTHFHEDKRCELMIFSCSKWNNSLLVF